MTKSSVNNSPLAEEQIRAHTVGELQPFAENVLMIDYDPEWPDRFSSEAERVRTALGARALQIEHAGSTSVPGLAAKPVIDVVLAVKDSSDENAYLPELEGAGYMLRIREPEWYEHRMLKEPDNHINLHVFTSGCPEIERMLLFRDWLRENAADRELYAHTKLRLAKREWKHVQNYADATSHVIEEILQRARTMRRIGR